LSKSKQCCPETVSKYVKDETLYKSRAAERDKFYDHNMKLLEQTLLEIKQLESKLNSNAISIHDTIANPAIPSYLNQSLYYDRICHPDESFTNNEGKSASIIFSCNKAIKERVAKPCNSVNTSLIQSGNKKPGIKRSTPKQALPTQPHSTIKAHMPKAIFRKPKCSNCMILLARGFSSANCPCHKNKQ
jgi:hypothetical protein